MTESNEASVIDKKKDILNTNTENYMSNIGSFVLTVIVLFIIIIVYYSSSGIVLYACKLAQSNILPTDSQCYPYNEAKPNIQPIQTNIFTTFSDPQLSMKIKFPTDDYNLSNKILDMFREYKNEPNSHFLANYFISIIESVIQFNYSSLSTILNMLNGLPEVLLVFLGPIMVSIITIFIFLFDHLYLIYLWFVNMGWFFKKNVNDSLNVDSKPKWEYVTFLEPVNYWIALCLVLLFVIVFFIVFPFFSVIAFLTLSWCIVSLITYTASMNNKSINAGTIIQDIFKYYKLPIMSIFSFLVIVSAFTKLGNIPGIFSIITLALIYFGIISIDIFNPINKDNLTPIVSYNQAKKTCAYTGTLKPKHGLLYNLLFGQKGGNITSELKKLGKSIS